MKRALFLAVLTLTTTLFAQQEKQIQVPESELTEQQKAKYLNSKVETKVQETHAWVGIGKEVSEAVNGSLSAVTTQTNNFAQTGVGKVTMALVVWKVVGDQGVHILGGVIEILIFLPVWIWSYRRTCMSFRLKTGKDTWQVVQYQNTSEKGNPSPRAYHFIVAGTLIMIILATVFSY